MLKGTYNIRKVNDLKSDLLRRQGVMKVGVGKCGEKLITIQKKGRVYPNTARYAPIRRADRPTSQSPGRIARGTAQGTSLGWGEKTN